VPWQAESDSTQGSARKETVDAYTPIKSKCLWWREMLDAEEQYNTRIKPEDVRVHCTCFVEGYVWTIRKAEVPANCPNSRTCRYYILHT